MKEIEFEETMKRDVPLVIVEAWYNALTKVLSDIFGFQFPEVIFIYNEGVVTSYRIPTIFHKEIPIKISEWLKSNEDVLFKLFTDFVSAECIINKKKSNLTELSNINECVKEIKDIVNLWAKGICGDIIAFWLPIWNNNHIKENGKALYTSKILNKAMKSREEGDKIFDEGAEIIYYYFSKLSKMLKLDYELLSLLSLSEIEKLKNLNVLPSNIDERKKGYAYLDSKLFSIIEFKDFIKKKNYKLIEEKIKENNKIKGITATKGQVVGKAKIILKRTHFDKLLEGDILIASMTTPMYYPIMQKAVAFVTDEGGVTCHAAIVSRELGKPCIVGTKVATKIIRDGDKIEVNADEGIITIIERAK